jgi:hypothetical protein
LSADESPPPENDSEPLAPEDAVEGCQPEPEAPQEPGPEPELEPPTTTTTTTTPQLPAAPAETPSTSNNALITQIKIL